MVLRHSKGFLSPQFMDCNLRRKECVMVQEKALDHQLQKLPSLPGAGD